MSAPILHAHCPNPSVGTLNNLLGSLLQTLITAQCAISAKQNWPEDYGDLALEKGLETYDFVVVGAGSAGSVVASRLSENRNWKVLVLEAGGDPPQESDIPSLYSYAMLTNNTWNYYTEPQTSACYAARDRSCYWPRGKMIGGTGGINGMLFVRGNRRDFDSWLAKGNVGWGWNDVLPYFQKAVTPVGNSTNPMGHVVLNDFNFYYDDILNLVCNASAVLGVPRVQRIGDDGAAIGCTRVPGTVENGKRMSTAKTYLGRARQRPNLHVIKNAHVTKINFDTSGRRAVSVSFVLRDRYKMSARIQRELVVSAGTIESPKLLMLSGVGPREHLNSLQIPVLHDLPVGNNLQDHLMTLLYFKLQARPKERNGQAKIMENMFNYLMYGKGPLSSHSTTSVVSFVNTVPNSNVTYPTTEFHNIFFHYSDIDAVKLSTDISAMQPQYANYLSNIINQTDMMNIFNVLSHPKSTGLVRLSSRNYKDNPRIIPNYLDDPEDLESMLRGVRFQERLVRTHAYRAVNATILRIPIKECDKWVYRSDAYWRCYIKYFSTTSFHVTGTVKMGPSGDSTACVSPRLRLRGAWNVRVADASIMPDVVSANTNAATIMIAERAADFIKDDWTPLDAKG
ncbi:PREDICTED: glucose dehydrogenase [FAD, quinone]-like [Rhagoletis zephyria]|uniref:glucose dehydrogenase [FAD, quinone]-like n=1 Tax=Rhagoletis zephyria TaxID=28612 RepID=UPI000811A09D|nr:PREDICTED: glucose dehydrogenase [FAD, quinone]-like [Rhagoletis zephyria]